MTLRILMLTAACAFFSTALLSQDIINKKNGRSDKAKILEISTKTVTYKMWDNLDGPTMVLPIREVKTVQFQNGVIQKIGRDDMLHPVKSARTDDRNHDAAGNYGKTILAAAPIYMTNTSAVGLGLSLEHIVDKNAYIGLYLPIGFSFDNPSTTNNKSSSIVWAYPGIKYYPTGNKGIARFAFGPSIVVAAGNEKRGEFVFDTQSQTSQYKEFTNNLFLMGLMLNHSLNLQPTPDLYLGMEFGIGIPYWVSETENLGSNSTYNTFDNGTPLVQFQCKVGYRF